MMNTARPKVVTVRNERSFSFAGRLGDTFHVHPGEIVGSFSLRPLIDNQLFTADRACIEVMFDFRAVDARVYRYQSVLGRMALWVPQDTRVARRDPVANTEFSLRTLLDTRTPQTLLTDDGDPIDVRMKYTHVQFEGIVEPDAVRVWLTVYVYDVCHTGKPGYEQVSYAVPLHLLLWRRAVIIHSDDFELEAAPFVDVSEISAEASDLPTSPIEVRRTEGVPNQSG